MGLRQCDKCSEMVDEAKAFCPGCGHAFVEEEKRQEKSKFEKLDHTVQFGQTMYNQMLSDMGLNISKSPDRPDKRIEMLTSLSTDAVAPVKPEIKPEVKADIKPEVRADVKVLTQETVKSPEKARDKSIPAATASRSNTKWYVLGGLAIVFLLPVALASTVFLVLDLLARLSQ